MQLLNNRKVKINFKISYILYFLIFIYIISISFVGALDYLLPDEISLINNENANSVLSVSSGENAAVSGEFYEYQAKAKLLGVIPVKNIDVDVYPNVKLIPGGNVFGVKFFTKGVLVVGMSDVESSEGIINPAQKADIKIKDVITAIDGKEVNTVEDMAKVIESSMGKEIIVNYVRDDIANKTTLKPLLSLTDKKYKTGLWVRDSTAGIGTITFYNPQNGSFAGLGHGICDVDTGKLMPLLRGTIVDISLNDIIKGKEGRPGELKGSFGVIKKGSLIGNTDAGVFGVLDNAPKDMNNALSIALKDEIKEGEAKIFADVDGNGIKEYKIEIVKIYRNNTLTKNFIIHVTDKDLLEKTGGIIQGMSGSPIVQDGKIVGAVTHVLVNNPTRGYGIFIENMLSKMPNLLQ